MKTVTLFHRTFLLYLAGSCMVLFAVGCGQNSNGRNSLTGKVSLDGEPLEIGIIQFIPDAGTTGPSAGAEIKNGEFFVGAEKGVLIGKYRVEITSVRATGRKFKAPGSDETTDEMRNFIPARFNANSELTAEVTNVADNKFDFAVTSQ